MTKKPNYSIRFRDKKDPLKLLIVTAKLLTGFDAPINKVMYLDKPMKDHTSAAGDMQSQQTLPRQIQRINR